MRIKPMLTLLIVGGLVFTGCNVTAQKDEGKVEVQETVETTQFAYGEMTEDFYFVIEDIFTITGMDGVVVVGVNQNSPMYANTEVDVLYGTERIQSTIGPIEVYQEGLVEGVPAGSNVGVLLQGLTKDDIHVNDIIVLRGCEDPTPKEEITLENGAGEPQWLWMEENDDESLFRTEETPILEYYEPETGELYLVLYYDEETKRGSGVSYGYGAENHKIGFSFQKYVEKKYQEPELFTYNGEPNDDVDVLENIQEFTEYDATGNIISYSYTGNRKDSSQEENAEENPQIKCEIKYYYREDGTLWKKEGVWDGRDYNISSDLKTSYFDELERETFSFEYITHGYLHKYYIYEGNDVEPKYCLVFDSGWDVYMIQYI